MIIAQQHDILCVCYTAALLPPYLWLHMCLFVCVTAFHGKPRL